MMKKAKDADAMNFENEQQSRYYTSAGVDDTVCTPDICTIFP